jgi:hypothetical protein
MPARGDTEGRAVAKADLWHDHKSQSRARLATDANSALAVLHTSTTNEGALTISKQINRNKVTR